MNFINQSAADNRHDIKNHAPSREERDRKCVAANAGLNLVGLMGLMGHMGRIGLMAPQHSCLRANISPIGHICPISPIKTQQFPNYLRTDPPPELPVTRCGVKRRMGPYASCRRFA